MKLIIAILGLLFFTHMQAQDYLNIMTFNIRYNNPNDSLNAWPYRIDKVGGQILFHETHIAGVQEALHGQLKDLQPQLTKYKYVGVGRDDGKEKGEYSAIFYDTTRLQVLKWKTFWLSLDPEVPGSKSWDAAITRLVTWAKFLDKKTKKQFYVFNTHFDHIGKIARAESAKLLLNRVNDIAGKTPCIVMGDFNATPNDEPIQVITDKNDPKHLKDSKSLSATLHYGPTSTFNSFKNKETGNQPIDYIFIKQGVKVLQHATLTQTWEGRFSSDHFPVFARVVIQ